MPDSVRGMMRSWLWLPLILFAAFVIVVAYSLYRPDDRTHRSRLNGQPLPSFVLPPASASRPGLVSSSSLGQAHLINVFASWCVPCISEAAVLGELAQRGVIIDGIAIRDRPRDLDIFLARNGNPYRTIGGDIDSSVQMALGSSGVPETFIVDRKGIIRGQHIGEITPDEVPGVLAELKAAE